MATHDTSVDVIIVGGGLVGASMACALSGHGLSIAVIEAVPLRHSGQPSYDDRTLALSLASSRIRSIKLLVSFSAESAIPILISLWNEAWSDGIASSLVCCPCLIGNKS